YFAMEYIDGQSLSKYLSRAKLGVDEKLRLFRKICSAVDYAHQSDVIHRDLKPGNILIDQSGEPHILDFGLAKAAGAELADADPLTLTGEFMGTLAYASPEQAKGIPNLIDNRSDVYSLGVILYEMLTGEYPYDVAGDLPEVLRTIAETEPGKPSAINRKIDNDVETIVLKALAKEPQRRYQSAGEMEQDLALHLDGLPIHARRDSLLYTAHKQARRAVSRHPWTARAIVVAGVLVLSVNSLHFGHPFRTFERMLESKAVALRQRLDSPGWPEELVVIALDDTTYGLIDELAAGQALDGVSASNLKSWRVLHGALMRRLAEIGPEVVAWDIFFRNEHEEFDARLVEGMKALQDAGGQIIVGYTRRNEWNRPAMLSRPIVAQADDVGSAYLLETGGMVYNAVLARDLPPYPMAPSLALATYAAYRHRGYRPHLVWHKGEPFLEVWYRRGDPNAPEGAQWLPEVDRVWCGDEYVGRRPRQSGMDPTGESQEAFFRTLLPAPEVLARHTVGYHEVFAADEATLGKWFAGKVVLIGDNRLTSTRKPDRRKLADEAGGREEFSCYMHAAVLSDLLNGLVRSVPLPDRLERMLLLCLSVVGVFIGLLFGDNRTWLRIGLIGVLLVALVIVISFCVIVVLGVVVRPCSIILALVVSAVGSAWISRLSQSWRRSQGCGALP
ncbi:MAG: protein kinase, partial [Phycisphaerae bacterium]|nr:protein kinase [Phycisphaerae bacterium]